MQYKWWLNLLLTVFFLNATTISFAGPSGIETEENETIIETPSSQASEPEFEERETEDDDGEEQIGEGEE